MATASSTRASEQSHLKAHFRLQVVESLMVEPVEDGVSHPAQDLLAEALTRDSQEAKRWIRDVYHSVATTQPTLAAGLIRCVGRLPYAALAPLGNDLVTEALAHADPEVREAAVRAMEAWEGPAAVSLLRAHLKEEPVAWLSNYIRRVITDLSE